MFECDKQLMSYRASAMFLKQSIHLYMYFGFFHTFIDNNIWYFENKESLLLFLNLTCS